jgi:hypothetical protein
MRHNSKDRVENDMGGFHGRGSLSVRLEHPPFVRPNVAIRIL